MPSPIIHFWKSHEPEEPSEDSPWVTKSQTWLVITQQQMCIDGQIILQRGCPNLNPHQLLPIGCWFIVSIRKAASCPMIHSMIPEV